MEVWLSGRKFSNRFHALGLINQMHPTPPKKKPNQQQTTDTQVLGYESISVIKHAH